MSILKWADKQRKALSTALLGGAFKNFVQSKGGTGELRKPLSSKEINKRKRNRKIAKASRQRNR